MTEPVTSSDEPSALNRPVSDLDITRKTAATVTLERIWHGLWVHHTTLYDYVHTHSTFPLQRYSGGS